MTSLDWSERAQGYVDSDAHRLGADLDLLVAWAAGARTALDVATGGGHVADRLRAAGLEVVTCDPAPGMRPDVICRAESLPFATGAFDVVACRTAAHHFADPGAAVREMARVSSDRVLIVDTVFMGEAVEEAEAIRDPSHVRNYTEAEWRAFVDEAGLEVVTSDPAPGMRPDVICRAESLPFADGALDVVVCRTAAHHFADPGKAVREMARVSSDRVLIVDTVFMGETVEEAEAIRDPSHVRNYTEAEWRAFIHEAGLFASEVELLAHSFEFAAWLDRTGCEGDDAARAEALLGDRVADGSLTLDKLAIRAVKGAGA
jgi:ubiquinone/menaquinone biosynthesis C-methylase UbiE